MGVFGPLLTGFGRFNGYFGVCIMGHNGLGALLGRGLAVLEEFVVVYGQGCLGLGSWTCSVQYWLFLGGLTVFLVPAEWPIMALEVGPLCSWGSFGGFGGVY